MKTVRNLAFTFATVTLFAACGNTQKPAEESHEGHNHGTEKTEVTKNETSSAQLKDDKLNAVYPHYLKLSAALIAADVAEAKVAAQAIELGAKELGNGAALLGLATKISNAADIEVQRTAFAALSADFIERVKASGVNTGEIYVEYCPMAMNDKGASWLSNEKDIKNPYYGESMLTCGEVKEMIK
ncbi:Protein of unknown function [Pedobacter steynii]|uniref:DUF3347 domain-containing protein n=1 Tax=Pedobacter steynii TaxID=430522 RepID=A0A1G9IU27_9SPHI|nr:DUF3347 domain-containing protein [Pedobacter steynii]NQX38045.1 DUF3347 domain-containing protein [Pedobacter steynii]SDL28575.1 Protein of unknown function [Pedobacter steynii]